MRPYREALGNLPEKNISESHFTRPFLLFCISASQRSETVRQASIGSGMVQLLLSVIGDLMPHQPFPLLDRHLTDIYTSSEKQDEIHATLPFFDFLVQTCQGSQAGGQVVLDAGILDLLVSVMVRDFSIPSLALKKDDADECRSMVLDVCQSLLMHLSAHADLLPVLMNHPISALWPTHHTFHEDLAISADARWRKRRMMWEHVDQSLVNDRLKTAPALYETPPRNIEETDDLEDICVDLLEFLRHVTFFLWVIAPDSCSVQ
jgi:hypothetical protein